MKWLKGEGELVLGIFANRERFSSSRRPFSQNTDIRVSMKSALLRRTPSLFMRTNTSATCSASTVRSSSIALKG